MIKKIGLTFMLLSLPTAGLASDIPNYAKDAVQESYEVASVNAAAVFFYAENNLYSISCKVGNLTDIQLQAGEEITYIGSGSTNQWVLDKATSGSGAGKRWHIYIKPLKMGVSTNLVINTDKRTYQLELSTGNIYNPIVNWSYPIDTNDISILKTTESISSKENIKPEKLNFNYKIEGDKNIIWLPAAVYDDGGKTYVRLPAATESDDAPVLFVKANDGNLEIVNYRYKDNCFIVDRIFKYAELRVGKKDKVVITKL